MILKMEVPFARVSKGNIVKWNNGREHGKANGMGWLGKVFLCHVFFRSPFCLGPQQSWTFWRCLLPAQVENGVSASDWDSDWDWDWADWEWRMWAAGGNTQYKSQLDLCHAFNWLLCRCRTRARSTGPSLYSHSHSRVPVLVFPYSCSWYWYWYWSLPKATILPSSISWKIEFFPFGLLFFFLVSSSRSG